jgi:hypothetical protein
VCRMRNSKRKRRAQNWVLSRVPEALFLSNQCYISILNTGWFVSCSN